MAFTPGFQRAEALDMLTMCAILGGYPGSMPAPPPGWTSISVSIEFPPFDNKWQLWRRTSDGAFAVVIRGTVEKAGSVIEDLLSLLMDATGTISLGGYLFPYQFAASPLASVHLGFAISTMLIAEFPGPQGIIGALTENGAGPESLIYITGHSQGAGMATLLRSYLQFAPGPLRNASYKTYVFAQPKPGNDHYASDFNSRFSNKGLAYHVENSLDWVLQVPFTIEFIGDLNVPNPLSVMGHGAHLGSVAMSPALTATAAIVAQGHHEIAARQIPRVRPAAEMLIKSRVPSAAMVDAATLASLPFHAPIQMSLNFAHAGSSFALLGVPCVGEQCNEEWYQHGTGTILELLMTQT